jgi:hypothetical protein
VPDIEIILPVLDLAVSFGMGANFTRAFAYGRGSLSRQGVQGAITH